MEITTNTVSFSVTLSSIEPLVIGFDRCSPETGCALGGGVGLAEGVTVGPDFVGGGVAFGVGIGLGTALGAKPGVGSKLIQPKPGR
jgi:hypothetical protein